MRVFSLFMILVTMAVLSFYQFDAQPLNIGHAAHPQAEGIAVVELFTSQGCSSCPPADRLLEKLNREAEDQGKAVYALSFHVDYWNYLGWSDPYSQAIFSDRQRTYAYKRNSRRVYTPQMIVNGSSEFVGSNESIARSEIKEALKQPANVQIGLSLKLNEDLDKIKVDYMLDQQLSGSVLQLAIVEKKVQTSVKRGENGGRQLSHVQVVRQFESISLENENSGQFTMDLPTDIAITEASVIAYVQDAKTWKISGASKLAIYTDE